jgi:hypothetical protein
MSSISWQDTWERVADITSWLEEPEARLLYDLATPGAIVIDLGVARGRSTMVMAAAGATVFAVSLWDWDWEGTCEEFQATRERFPEDAQRRVIPIYGTSWDVLACLRQARVQASLVFVDACHDYECVSQDAAVAARILTPGGKIAFHDYGMPNWPGVQCAVDELLSCGWKMSRRVTGHTLAVLERMWE